MNIESSPAFPRPSSTDEHNKPCNVFDDQAGMTMFEHYAGLAMQGILAAGMMVPGDDTRRKTIARQSALMARALCAELSAAEGGS